MKEIGAIFVVSTSEIRTIQLAAIKRRYIYIYHINCGVIQGFPALRKAVTTHVKKYRIFSRVLI